MKALKICVNGEPVAKIGHEDAETIDYAFRHFSDSNVSCVGHAIIDGGADNAGCIYWPEIKLKDSDEVFLKIIEVQSNSELDASFPGTHRIGGSGGLELACSICGKTQDEVKKLIAGETGNICEECTDYVYELMVSEGVLTNSDKP
jgi:hypothetical protein